MVDAVCATDFLKLPTNLSGAVRQGDGLGRKLSGSGDGVNVEGTAGGTGYAMYS